MKFHTSDKKKSTSHKRSFLNVLEHLKWHFSISPLSSKNHVTEEMSMVGPVCACVFQRRNIMGHRAWGWESNGQYQNQTKTVTSLYSEGPLVRKAIGPNVNVFCCCCFVLFIVFFVCLFVCLFCCFFPLTLSYAVTISKRYSFYSS